MEFLSITSLLSSAGAVAIVNLLLQIVVLLHSSSSAAATTTTTPSRLQLVASFAISSSPDIAVRRRRKHNNDPRLGNNQLPFYKTHRSWLSSSSSSSSKITVPLLEEKDNDNENENNDITNTCCTNTTNNDNNGGDEDYVNDHHIWIWNDNENDGSAVTHSKWRRCCVVQNQNNKNNAANNVNAADDNDYNEDTNNEDTAVALAIRRTMNWCKDFVVKLDLCPWAKSSIQTKDAIQFFVVVDRSEVQANSSLTHNQDVHNKRIRIVHDVARQFQNDILHTSSICNEHDEYEHEHEHDHNHDNQTNQSGDIKTLERAAIYFIIFLSNSNNNKIQGSKNNYNGDDENDNSVSFLEFFEWFTDIEDNWVYDGLLDDVTIAPFHPDWQFATDGDDDDNDALNYEKRSPYPIVSFVSTNVVEKAGAIVTESIGENNREILLSIERQQQRGDHNHDDDDDDDDDDANQHNDNKDASTVAKLWRSAIDR